MAAALILFLCFAVAALLHINLLRLSPCGCAEDALLGVLQHRGLYTTEVAAELAAGIEYWERERRLCALMLEQPCVPDGGHDPGFGLEELQATSVGKSFDYRVRGRVEGEGLGVALADGRRDEPCNMYCSAGTS